MTIRDFIGKYIPYFKSSEPENKKVKHGHKHGHGHPGTSKSKKRTGANQSTDPQKPPKQQQDDQEQQQQEQPQQGQSEKDPTATKPQPQEKPRSSEEKEWGCGNWCEYVFVVVLAFLLLFASIALTIFWIFYFREGISWDNPKLQFNLHPVLMVAGFITFSGFSMLFYRVCRCFRRIYVKLIHTIFHALAMPCIVLGFFAVLGYHNRSTPAIPNFYSMHSWLGFITMGLFVLQVVFGFFSFLIMWCCIGATEACRETMVPIHATFGLTTFMLAIATCLTGLTERAVETLGENYSKLPGEGVVMNLLAIVLTALSIVVAYICMREELRFRRHVLVRAGEI